MLKQQPHALTDGPGPLPPPKRPLRRFFNWLNPLRDTMKKCTSPQVQCALLQKLPPELRRQIWEEALGHHTIRLVVGLSIKGTHQQIIFKPKNHVGIIALVKTCRMVYAETIDLLYANMTFWFNINRFYRNPCDESMIIMPQHLDRIRSLRIEGDISEMDGYPIEWETTRTFFEVSWPKAWGVVAGMAGLRELGVVILMDGPLHLKEAREYMKPILEALPAGRPKLDDVVLQLGTAGSLDQPGYEWQPPDQSWSRIWLERDRGYSDSLKGNWFEEGNHYDFKYFQNWRLASHAAK